jgi:methionyl aminopeptidase
MIRVKSTKQIKGIRKSCQLAAKTLKHLEQYVVAGITTQEINDEAERFIQNHGAISAPLNYKGFPKSICTSINEVVCHGIPSNTVLRDGDIVNVDVTTILNGYYGDTSTMFAVGNIGPDTQRLLDVTKQCLQIGIEQVRPGNKFGNIGYEISIYAITNGFSVVYEYCGHGVGLDFHEDPQVPHVADKNSGPQMQVGNIFTIEPMINAGEPKCILLDDGWTAQTIDGKLSAQYEHTVLVTKKGYEILTLLGEDHDTDVPDQYDSR